MKSFLALCLGTILSSMFCANVFASDDKDSQSQEKFVPTTEWQKVKKGQPLPAGLHYRINLSSGQTEAKLLDPADPSQSHDVKTGLIALPQLEKSEDVEDSPYLSKEELQKILADVNADDVAKDPANTEANNKKGREKLRSYEELKKEFGSINLTVKTDMELLNDLVVKTKILLTSNEYKEEELVLILKDLEYLVHQIDNAREFVRLGGLHLVILPSLNSTFPTVRSESLWLLGSAAQSNPKVQIAVLNAGMISKLVKVSVLDPDISVHSRAIYALSCIIRQFPAAQARLIEEGGIASLGSILDDKRTSDFKTKMRVITLINDLILERLNIRKASNEYHGIDFTNESEAIKKVQQHKLGELKEKLRQYDVTNLEKHLSEDGWCQRMSGFLRLMYESEANFGRAQRRDDLGSVMSKNVPYRPEHDAIEKVVGTLFVLRDLCQNDFQQDKNLQIALENFLVWYQDLSVREEVVHKQPQNVECVNPEECSKQSELDTGLYDSDMYYTSIAGKLRELIDYLWRHQFETIDVRDEL